MAYIDCTACGGIALDYTLARNEIAWFIKHYFNELSIDFVLLPTMTMCRARLAERNNPRLRIYALEIRKGPRIFLICESFMFLELWRIMMLRWTHWYEVLEGPSFKLYMDLDYKIEEAKNLEMIEHTFIQFAEFCTNILSGIVSTECNDRKVACHMLTSSSVRKASSHLIFEGICCGSLVRVKFIILYLLRSYILNELYLGNTDCMLVYGYNCYECSWDRGKCAVDFDVYKTGQNFRMLENHKWNDGRTLKYKATYTGETAWKCEDNPFSLCMIVTARKSCDYELLMENLQDDFGILGDVLILDVCKGNASSCSVERSVQSGHFELNIQMLPEGVRWFIGKYLQHFRCKLRGIKNRTSCLTVVYTSNRSCPLRRNNSHCSNNVSLMIDFQKGIVFEYCWDSICRQTVKNRDDLSWTKNAFHFRSAQESAYEFGFSIC